MSLGGGCDGAGGNGGVLLLVAAKVQVLAVLQKPCIDLSIVFFASFLKQLPKKYILYNKLRCFKILVSFYFWFKGGGGVDSCSLQEGLRSC